MGSNSVCVGVLSLHDSKESKAICNAVEALGHDPEWLREWNTIVHMVDGEVRLHPDVDVVANRMLLSNTDQPSEHIGIAETIAALRPTLNDPHATALAAHKIASATRLANAGLPVPETVFALNGDHLNRYRKRFGPEAVYKTAIGTHGGGAWKVDTSDSLSPMVGQRRAFLQELVGRDGRTARDVRVYVVDGSIVGAMTRYAAESDWRTNVARGGSVEDATESLPGEVAEMARKASTVLGLDYAGVDLIEGADGWFILEVNPTAGFRGLYAATGRSPAPHIAKLAIERGGASVDDALVTDLAATLDDSIPSCMPSIDTSGSDEPVVIGLSEQVVVNGTRGNRTVIGECDTGIARTVVDLQLAADIGAGPIHTVSVERSDRPDSTRPVVDLVLGIGGTQHTVEANIEDRAGMDYPLVLGRDVLKHYYLDVSRRIESGSSFDSDEE